MLLRPAWLQLLVWHRSYPQGATDCLILLYIYWSIVRFNFYIIYYLKPFLRRLRNLFKLVLFSRLRTSRYPCEDILHIFFCSRGWRFLILLKRILYCSIMSRLLLLRLKFRSFPGMIGSLRKSRLLDRNFRSNYYNLLEMLIQCFHLSFIKYYIYFFKFINLEYSLIKLEFNLFEVKFFFYIINKILSEYKIKI